MVCRELLKTNPSFISLFNLHLPLPCGPCAVVCCDPTLFLLFIAIAALVWSENKILMVAYTKCRMYYDDGSKNVDDSLEKNGNKKFGGYYTDYSRSGGGGGFTDYSQGPWRTASVLGDPNDHHECTEQCSNPVIMAARNALPDELDYALETMPNKRDGINSRDCQGRTALHWAVIMACNCDSCVANSKRCVEVLVKFSNADINAQDNQGLTPLHVAAENQSTLCASILLEHGADVSIKSKDGVKALVMMIEKIPDAMESLLNRAVTIKKYDSKNVKCEVSLDFGAIVGYSETRGRGRYNKNKPNTEKLGKPRKEMLLLSILMEASSGSRKKILRHPLIASFLYLKWRRVQPVFWATIIFNILQLMLYTLYILDVYLMSCPYRPKVTEPKAVKAAKALGLLTPDNHTLDFVQFSWFSFIPTITELTEEMKADECHLEIGPTVKSVLLLGLTLFIVINEIFKMLPAPRAYIKRTMNKIQWSLFFLIFLTSWPVFMSQPNISFWQYQTAACGLFLAWALMLSQIGKFPKLGLYVDILGHVLTNFGFFMFTYASLIIAFALAFCVLFPGNAPYSSIPLAVLKVLMMMVGEVNYEDLFYGKEEDPVDDLLYPLTGHILYGAFVIMITIVLSNLLVGLTVSDIQGLKKDAELTRVSRQIAEISQLESFIFSGRVQSLFPGRLGSFLRESILVVPRTKSTDEENTRLDNDMARNFMRRIRPNDPNDTTVPEDLKASVLKVASIHHISRLNKCPKSHPENVNRNSSESDRQISNMMNSPNLLRIPTINLPSSDFERSYDVLQRLEEKIVERMAMQMDRLYQKLENKFVES